jgi:hypothetical protein
MEVDKICQVYGNAVSATASTHCQGSSAGLRFALAKTRSRKPRCVRLYTNLYDFNAFDTGGGKAGGRTPESGGRKAARFRIQNHNGTHSRTVAHALFPKPKEAAQSSNLKTAPIPMGIIPIRDPDFCLP